MPKIVVRRENEHLYAEQPTTEGGRALTSAVLRLWHAERAQAQRVLQSSGLSNLDLTALRYLVQGYRDGRDLSPKDLIVMLDSSSATVTNVVERLVGRSYVIRVQHPRDRRAHYLVPTEEAISLLDTSLGAYHAEIVRVIDQLAPEQVETSAAVIARIADALDDLPAPPA
jgi:DNA-binding MarR family transcriptional regulator